MVFRTSKLFATMTPGSEFLTSIAKSKSEIPITNIVTAGTGSGNALAGFGGNWDYQSLNAFLAKPKVYISGTKMNFGGLKKPKDRANLIAWMRVKADSPAALPTTDDIAAEGVN